MRILDRYYLMFTKVITGPIALSGSTEDKIKTLTSGEGAAAKGGNLNTLSETVNSYGAGGYTILRNVFIYVAIIALIAGAVGLMIHAGNAQKRDEAKSVIGYRIVAIILGFAAVAMVVFLSGIGERLFG
ncbi:MAG: hypothetical protein K6F84_05245 [Lachnospiraceae bacterium]|nr:hypothetical protein [Lachnospiraceae bacterium]